MSQSKATKEALDALHGALAKSLADKIAKGEATAADLAVARQFLKDNGVDAIPRDNDNALDKLRSSLPFATPAGVEEEQYSH